jgi:hypothetical protein
MHMSYALVLLAKFHGFFRDIHRDQDHGSRAKHPTGDVSLMALERASHDGHAALDRGHRGAIDMRDDVAVLEASARDADQAHANGMTAGVYGRVCGAAGGRERPANDWCGNVQVEGLGTAVGTGLFDSDRRRRRWALLASWALGRGPARVGSLLEKRMVQGSVALGLRSIFGTAPKVMRRRRSAGHSGITQTICGAGPTQ